MISKAPAKRLCALLCITVVLFAAGCFGNVIGDANTSTREFDLRGFTRVETGSAFEIDIVRGDDFRVSITLNDNLFDYLEASISGNTLHIRMRPGFGFIRATQQAAITMPGLDGIDFSGAVRGTATGFSTPGTLEVRLSGASRLQLDNIQTGVALFEISGASGVTGELETGDCRFKVSGASLVEFTGSGEDLDLEGSGASRFHLFEFEANDVSVNLSGASSAEINMDGRLDGELSGASRLEYEGSPTLGRLETSGASSIRQKQ